MQKTKKKTNRWIIIAIIAVVVFLLLAVGGCWIYVCHLRNELTDVKPQEIATAQVTEPEKRKLGETDKKFSKGVKEGKSMELELLGEQLDKMIALFDEFKPLRGHVSLKLDGEFIKAKVSLPMEKFPMFDGRYLNGEFKLKASVSNGKLNAEVIEGTTEQGKPYPKWLVKKLNDTIASPAFQQRRSADQWLKKLELLKVMEGKLKLKTK